MEYSSINLNQKLSLFEGTWQPKVIAEMNDYQFKLVKESLFGTGMTIPMKRLSF